MKVLIAVDGSESSLARAARTGDARSRWFAIDPASRGKPPRGILPHPRRADPCRARGRLVSDH